MPIAAKRSNLDERPYRRGDPSKVKQFAYGRDQHDSALLSIVPVLVRYGLHGYICGSILSGAIYGVITDDYFLNS